MGDFDLGREFLSSSIIAAIGLLDFARVDLRRLEIGRVTLYLLDADISDNQAKDRTITHQLYGGDNEHRLKQELLLVRQRPEREFSNTLQRELFFLPDRETAIGQEIAALRARSSNRVVSCQRLDPG